jgi:hypothetical protein
MSKKMKNHTRVKVINNPSKSSQEAERPLQTLADVRTTGMKFPAFPV